MVDERLTYGYRRLTALVNRKLRHDGKPTVNAKRVLRIMQRNPSASHPVLLRRPGTLACSALTLQRHSGLPSPRTHDGKIIVLASNPRWSACDRQIIAWSAVADAGVSGEMVRDLMIAAVERRFGTARAPHTVEWLSDNGSAYTAKPTAETAAALGLTLLFTPVRSPESNGMSESFVKTLKRDYARVTILPDAAAILANLPDSIEDYCEVHPHSGLKFRSPREFMRLSA